MTIAKKVINIIVPLFFLIGITILSSFLYLYDGVSVGDDSAFHLGNIYDTYYGLTHGLSIDSTNHLMMGIYSYNTHLFYAPLPHYFAAILMVIFNCSNIVAMKLTVSFFCFIAALFFYFFAKKVSNSLTVSLLSAAFFIFCPYRMFCGYCRFAFAETIAISLLPVLLYGIYAYTHDEKPTYRSFIAIILGLSGLILSHPFTALSMAIFCIAYMILRYKNTWNMLKAKKGLILSITTVVMVFMLVGFYFFPMIIAKSSNLYRVSDNEVMWTNYKHVADSTGSSANFSGFLNIDWIKGKIDAGKWPEDEPLYVYLVEIILLVSAFVALLLSERFLKKFFKNKYLALGINLLAFWLLPLTFIWLIHDVVFYFAMLVITIIYIINYLLEEKGEIKVAEKSSSFHIEKDLLKDLLFLFGFTVLYLLLILIGQLWHLVPSIFYSCQFAWRLWSMVSVTFSWLFLIGLNQSFKSPHRLKFASPLLILPSILMIATMSFREKGVALRHEGWFSRIIKQYDEKDAMANAHIGVMDEYMPAIFYDNKYKSEYDNSLFTTIKKTIGHPNQYIFTKDEYLSPSFLEGDGSLTVIELNTPDVIFDATVNETSLIQLPQFYYDGYQITLVDKATGETSNAEIVNVDSLVSFKANKGEYTITVNYKGPMIRRVFNVIFFVGVGGIVGLSVLAVRELYLEKKKKVEESTISN